MQAIDCVTRQTIGIELDGGISAEASPPQGEETLMPDPAGTPTETSIMGVMLLLERCLAAQKKSANDRRDAAEESQARKEAQSIEAMREEANDTFKTGLVSGFISIGSGALQMAGAGMALHGSKLETDAAKMAESGLTKSASTLSARAKELAGVGGAIQAAGPILNGGGKMADGALNAEVKEDQRAQAEHKTAADAYARKARREDDGARETEELRTKTFARLEQILQESQQTRLALIQRA